MRYLPLSPRSPALPQTGPTGLGTVELPGPSPLLAGITEGLKTGILVLSTAGTIVHTNRYAQQICQEVSPRASSASGRSRVLPEPIRRLVHALIESQDLFPGYDLILEDEIATKAGITIQISTRWLPQGPDTRPAILVTLETPYQPWPRSQASNQN
ncbi:hypothetical protein [Trichothermofontia sp.]